MKIGTRVKTPKGDEAIILSYTPKGTPFAEHYTIQFNNGFVMCIPPKYLTIVEETKEIKIETNEMTLFDF